MKRNIAGTSLIAAALLCTACHITLFAVEPPSAASAPQTSERQQEQGKALIDAIRKGDHDRVKSLLEDGVDAMSAGGNSPVSPLCVAATRDDEKSVELLLAHGADPNDRDQGDLPLVCSAYQGNLKMVAFLIDHGAKTEPGPGPMPLLAATDTGRVEMVRLLLAKGADVNATDRHGETALHRAAYAGLPEVAKVLLAAGANANARTKSGKAPLDFARMSAGAAARKKDERTPARLAGIAAVETLLSNAATRPAL